VDAMMETVYFWFWDESWVIWEDGGSGSIVSRR
jgi:uncharacterized membrane protein